MWNKPEDKPEAVVQGFSPRTPLWGDGRWSQETPQSKHGSGISRDDLIQDGKTLSHTRTNNQRLNSRIHMEGYQRIHTRTHEKVPKNSYR